MSDSRDTIAAIATSPGNAGIGIIRVSGKQSLDIATQITGLNPEPRKVHACTFADDNDQLIDQGLLLYFKGPDSYTGEDVVEFHGHGGQVVLNLLLNEIVSRGSRLARPGEFTERAFLNNKLDLVQAEAVADLIESNSEAAARCAARSLQGDFSKRVHHINEVLVSIRAYVEGALDFPEEEIDFLKESDVVERTSGLKIELEKLLLNAKEGKKLRDGIRVAIIGRPNVGKSSLLNRLAGEERAIVTSIAGTTRDTIEAAITMGGASINIVDTAGLRDPEGEVEAEGIRRSIREMKESGLVIFVTDQKHENEEDVRWLDELESGKMKAIVLHNKIDLLETVAAITRIDDRPHVYASMKTGEGMELLLDLLQKMSVSDVTGEGLVLARMRHIDALETAAARLESGLQELLAEGRPELFAEELKLAQGSLNEITGEYHSDDLLGEIFSRFCIGK